MDSYNCQLTRFPAEVLGKRAKRIEKIDENIRRIADEMIDIMLANKGVGLAGPQAGVPLRIFVVSLDGKKENAKVYINPEITPSEKLEPLEEGCLSLPGIYTKVRRYSKCSVRATGLDGREFTEEAEGMLARAFQHECDHLDGVMIIDRIGQVAKIALRGRLKELRQRLAEG
jgi:peptide deformylase